MKKRIPEQIRSEISRAGITLSSEEESAIIRRAEELYDTEIAAGDDSIDAYRDAIRDFKSHLNEYAEDTAAETTSVPPSDGIEIEPVRPFSSITGMLNTVLWLSTVMLYFILSFTFGRWHLTWLLFVSAAVGTIIIKMISSLEKGADKNTVTPYVNAITWLCAVIVYFLWSFTFGGWNLTWLIFVVAAIVTSVVNVAVKGERN